MAERLMAEKWRQSNAKSTLAFTGPVGPQGNSRDRQVPVANRAESILRSVGPAQYVASWRSSGPRGCVSVDRRPDGRGYCLAGLRPSKMNVLESCTSTRRKLLGYTKGSITMFLP